MSKKYVNKTCPYCAIAGSSRGPDHAICREFFLPAQRPNLPKVPACGWCNNAKSRLEHYLTAVMPFGGNHAAAGDTLTSLVPKRFAKNRPVSDAIRHGLDPYVVSHNGGPWENEAHVPLDGAKLVQLFEYITKGLAYWHWGIYLPASEYVVRAEFLDARGRGLFERWLALDTRDRKRENLGDGVFLYECVQSAECPELTVWRMSLYGAEVGNDSQIPFERNTAAYAITIPMRMPVAAKIERLLGRVERASAA